MKPVVARLADRADARRLESPLTTFWAFRHGTPLLSVFRSPSLRRALSSPPHEIALRTSGSLASSIAYHRSPDVSVRATPPDDGALAGRHVLGRPLSVPRGVPLASDVGCDRGERVRGGHAPACAERASAQAVAASSGDPSVGARSPHVRPVSRAAPVDALCGARHDIVGRQRMIPGRMPFARKSGKAFRE